MNDQLKEYATLVQLMRTTQKDYFRAGGNTLSKRDLLSQSKQLERQVDEATEQILDPKEKTGNLFD